MYFLAYLFSCKWSEKKKIYLHPLLNIYTLKDFVGANSWITVFLFLFIFLALLHLKG